MLTAGKALEPSGIREYIAVIVPMLIVSRIRAWYAEISAAALLCYPETVAGSGNAKTALYSVNVIIHSVHLHSS